MTTLQLKQESLGLKHRFPWWILYVLALIILSILYLFNGYSSPQIIKPARFETELISRNAVEKIVVIDRSIAQIYIKPEFASDPAFRDVFKQVIGKKINTGPHYWFYIGSVESFTQRLDELQKDKSPSSKIPVEYRPGIGGWRDIIN